jgi:hypothetical protein
MTMRKMAECDIRAARLLSPLPLVVSVTDAQDVVCAYTSSQMDREMTRAARKKVYTLLAAVPIGDP